MSALRKARVNVWLIDIVEPNRVEDVDAVEAYNNDVAAEVLNSMPQSRSDVYVYHRCWAAPPLSRQGRHYWRTMFETSGLPASWVQASHDYDGLWVPSTFNLSTFGDAGIDPDRLWRIPSPNPNWIPPRLPARGQLASETARTAGTTDFLFVGKWEERKGLDILLDAFSAAFTATDNTRLILKTKPFNEVAGDHHVIRRQLSQRVSPKAAPIVLYDHHLKRRELLALYQQSACFIAPSRGEGWGRGTVEALLTGLPVITTNWGGSTEFLPLAGSQARGLNWQLAPCSDRAVREWSYFEGQLWAEPDRNQLVQLLRSAAEHPPTSHSVRESAPLWHPSAPPRSQYGQREQAFSAGGDIANRFRGEVIAQQIITTLASATPPRPDVTAP